MLQHETDDLRVEAVRPVLPAAVLHEELPLAPREARVVCGARASIRDILARRDDRLLVVAGPCSIHDPAAALEYGQRLREQARRFSDSLLIVMRVYFEKPRTTVGWKGLINDPELDGSCQINRGLRVARGLLLDLLGLGLPAGSEFLDTITPQFTADLISWGAIGARTTESQIHRELASGLSMPVGFKNGTDGNVQIAVDAIRAASHPHSFLSVTKQGTAAIVSTRGNDACHLILRGGEAGPNYERPHVERAAQTLARANVSPQIMVDASHGNSRKDHRNQPRVAHDLAEQLRAGERRLCGVMLESHLVEGRQDLSATRPLRYGQSITDACLAFDDTVCIFEELARAVDLRRAHQLTRAAS